MYQTGDLVSYPYFERILQDTPLSHVLDSLTGVISREYMLGLVHDLIDAGKEFTLAMIDLDNFKSYNDHYGHATGDHVLSLVADMLTAYVGGRGLVGRFGGDEFLVLAMIGNEYQAVHDFYERMYTQGNNYSMDAVFRRDIQVDHKKLFISATIGSASFPKDAPDYETLFQLIDKTLYRGKSKGRNCYIIYLPEKHAGLDIPKLARHSLYDTFLAMASGFDNGDSLPDRLYHAYQVMRKDFRFHFLLYLDASHQMYDVEKQKTVGTCEDLSPLISDGCYACSSLGDLEDYPRLRALTETYDISSLLILPIGPLEKGLGFVVLSPEPHTLHIWQDEEFAAGFFLARLLWEVKGNEKTNPRA